MKEHSSNFPLPPALASWLAEQLKPEQNQLKGFALINRKVREFPPADQDEISRNSKLAYFTLLSELHKGKELIRQLLSVCDYREQALFLSNLQTLKNPDQYVDLAREGSRTNIIAVFDALALDNEFPALHFDEIGWRQLVMKAIFLDRPLYQIVGLESRNNIELASTARDFIQERFVAGRKVNPEICRLFTGVDIDLTPIQNIDNHWNDSLFHRALELAKQPNQQDAWQEVSAAYFND